MKNNFGFFYDNWKRKYVLFSTESVPETVSNWVKNFIRSQGLDNLVFNHSKGIKSTQVLFKVTWSNRQIKCEYRLTKIKLHQAPFQSFVMDYIPANYMWAV